MLTAGRERLALLAGRPSSDLDVAAAAAQVAGQRERDLLVRRLRALLEQRWRGQDHAGRAVAALEGVRVGERALDRMVAAEALGRRDRRALGERREQQAGRDRLAVDERRAGAAHADAARLANGQDRRIAREAP